MGQIKPNIKEKILVIGGSGFIGFFITAEALKKGYHVVVVSKNLPSKTRQIHGATYLAIDVSSKQDLKDNLKQTSYHYVINLSGYVDHSPYFHGGDKVFEEHFNIVKNLIEILDRKSLKTFIHAGSSDEYGQNVAPQNEGQREHPISPYSFAKTSITHFLQMLNVTENFPVVVLRLFLVYGPYQSKNRFIPQVIRGCISNLPFPVSDGKQIRDFCFISDVVDAFFACIKNELAYGEVINIASGIGISIKDVILLIQSLTKVGEPQFGKVALRRAENIELFANISKAKKLINWSPKISIEDGLKKTITEYKRNIE